MTQAIHADPILIIDFGSQYTQLIARRVRELGVYCEIFSYTADAQAIRQFAPKGVILSGGPESVSLAHTPRIPDVVFALGCPLLGICYGMQAMALQLGGQVASAAHREFGSTQICLRDHSDLFATISDRMNADGESELDVWMSHGDRVTALPPGFTLSGVSEGAPIAAIADDQRRYYGVQFHPEVTHTTQGVRLLERFVRHICGCAGQWTTQHILTDAIDRLRDQLGKDHVLLGLSGGVDSAVVGALLHRAVGQQLHCVLVDNGLLRKDEVAQIRQAFAAHHRELNLTVVDAAQEFFNALRGVTDPEHKRKIIGKLFIDIFERQAAQLPAVQWLAQGTIYPDVVESAATQHGKAHVIKSHHNVGGLPSFMKLKLVEPLRELFKDEVRRLGLELGLPYDLVYRHPFPGPGLAVRIIGEVTPHAAEIVRAADAIFIEELRRAHYYDKVSQAFAVFLPIKSVAVKGDARDHSYVIALRAVETVDFMTAHWASLPSSLLAIVANRIINEIAEVSRVVYDISTKPPSTIEWE